MTRRVVVGLTRRARFDRIRSKAFLFGRRGVGVRVCMRCLALCLLVACGVPAASTLVPDGPTGPASGYDYLPGQVRAANCVPGSASPCGRVACDAGLYCDHVSDTCKVTPALAAGDRCGVTAGEPVPGACPPGFVCATTCVSLPLEGSPCLGERCAAGLHCKYKEPVSICERLGEAGEACTKRTCVDGLECRAGKCGAACQ